jgi:hypothetical protein
MDIGIAKNWNIQMVAQESKSTDPVSKMKSARTLYNAEAPLTNLYSSLRFAIAGWTQSNKRDWAEGKNRLKEEKHNSNHTWVFASHSGQAPYPYTPPVNVLRFIIILCERTKRGPNPLCFAAREKPG